MRSTLPVAVAIAITCGSAAHAQSDRELATRQEMIAQGTALADHGKHAEALDLLKRAGDIKMTSSLRLVIAQEQAAVGRLADAYGNAKQCKVEAEADARLHNRERILADCGALETSLGKRVARVTVKLRAPTPPDAHVKISGEELSAALVGEPYVVSPGKLTIEVTATTFLPYRTSLDVPEGGLPVVDVQLAVDPAAQPCPAGQERAHGACVAACSGGKVRTADEGAECCWPRQSWNTATSSCAGAPECGNGLLAQGVDCVALPPRLPPVEPQPPAGMPTQRKLAWGVGGAGAVGLVVGGVLGGLALSELGTAESQCTGEGAGNTRTGCSATAIRDRGTAGSYATGSTVGFIAGGVLLAAGVTLYLTTPKPGAIAIGVEAAPGGGSVVGRF